MHPGGRLKPIQPCSHVACILLPVKVKCLTLFIGREISVDISWEQSYGSLCNIVLRCKSMGGNRCFYQISTIPWGVNHVNGTVMYQIVLSNPYQWGKMSHLHQPL